MAAGARGRVLTRDDRGLLLGGERHQLISGSICYFRIHPSQWEDRLDKLVALGANAVEVYVPWNLHEPKKGQWDFEGQADVAAFVRLSGEKGLNVLLRPGPYICAEWMMGGLPWWLLAQEPRPRLRCSDPAFMVHVEAYLRRLAQELGALVADRGGPIVAVQVENEYGYWGADRRYLEALKALIRDTLGHDLLLFTVDGVFTPETQHLGGLDCTLRTASFGSSAKKRFEALREAQQEGPLVCMEFWVGWFTTWGCGAKNERTAASVASELGQILALGASVNLFVFAGGTSFGFTAGANLDAATGRLEPHVTSYDYDGLLTESGALTEKFYACRAVILGRSPPVPQSLSVVHATLPPRAVRLTQEAVFMDALPQLTSNCKHDVRPQPIEALGEGTGYVHYRYIGTEGGGSGDVSPSAAGALSALRGLPLKLYGVRDFALVLCDGQPIGTWDRSRPPERLELPRSGAGQLDILVEVTARVNFGHGVAEQKGLTGHVAAGIRPQDERELLGWESRALPMRQEQLAAVPWRALAIGGAGPGRSGPGLFRGCFHLRDDEPPADTWLRVPGFRRGFVALNGFNLGWHRQEGPQFTLYAPAALLRPGENEVVVFELLGPPLQGTDGPIVRLEAGPVWGRNRAQLAANQAREVWGFCQQVGVRQMVRLARRDLGARGRRLCLGGFAILVAAAVLLFALLAGRGSRHPGGGGPTRMATFVRA